jgi:peptide deformylase
MALLEILTLPDERLRQVSAPITHFDDELRAFIADLEETRQAGPAAVGIAAPQVNVFKRIVIVDVSGRKKHAKPWLSGPGQSRDYPLGWLRDGPRGLPVRPRLHRQRHSCRQDSP